MIAERDRDERKNNIIIKGMDREGEITRERMEEFRREKLNIEVKVIRCRRSGGVLVVKLENEHMKKKVMRNKSKLKGRNSFIENNLSWEERKVQEKINRWI